ncbi:MAG: response regulator [Anaerolineae bacterium]|nr:response regulator [Anaerolineae bacterium]
MTKRGDSSNMHTRHLAESKLPTGPVSAGNSGPLDLSLPWVIEMRIVGTPSLIQVQVGDKMVIGRSDAEQGVFPEIDLLPYNAFGQGVSRRHAVIETHDGRLYIKDLDSTNGTRLNGGLLTPHEPARLRHGDQLSFGQLRVQVLFAVVPMHDMTGRYHMPENFKKQTQELARMEHNKRILVIEDDLSVAEVFSATLDRAGYNVTHVNNVVNALSMVIQNMPDVIVLDLMLPDFNGLDFLRYVRKNHPHPRVPIIVVSAASGGFQTNQAIEAGADVFLTKPVSVEDLLHASTKAVGLRMSGIT